MIKFPEHKCGLYLDHNAHKDVYESPEQYYIDDSFKNEEDKKLAFSNDDVWTLQWYPDTPVGFYKAAASSLELLLEFALEVEQSYNK